MLIIVIAIAGLVFGHDAAKGAIVAQLSGLIGRPSAEILQSTIRSASLPGPRVFAMIIGIGTLLLTATGALTEIQSALNAIWRAAPSAALAELVRARLVSLGLIVTLGFLILVSLVVSAGLAALGGYLRDLFPGAGFLISVLNWTMSLVLISTLFAAIYKILPDKPIAWRDVAVGSVATVVLFTIGKSHRQQQRCIELWSGWCSGNPPFVGLLLGSDFPAWRRIYASVCRNPRQPRSR